MRQVGLLLTLLLGFVISACNNTADLNEHEIFSILNQIMKDNSFRPHIICSTFDKVPRERIYQAGFSENDLNFIDHQTNKIKSLKIKQGDLKEYWPVDNKEHEVIIDSTCESSLLTRISFPLISADREKVVLGITELGQGGIYLYVKSNGKWQNRKILDHWIE
jgi:hypothetical protein